MRDVRLHLQVCEGAGVSMVGKDWHSVQSRSFLLWLFDDIKVIKEKALYATACCMRLSCFCLSGLKGMGATRIPSRTHGSALQPQTTSKAAQCFAAKNGARAEQKQL
jgi:hypothetical protein